MEKITIPSTYTIAQYSIDGGAKWKAYKADTFSEAKFPKLLNKDLTLKFKDSGGNEITFPKINKRATLGKYVINYAIYADDTGDTAGAWALTVKDGTAAVKEGILISVADSTKKKPDEKGYGRSCENHGVNVKELPSSGKVLKSVYLIKTAPKKNTDGTYTAASKQKKITAASQQKAPTYKIDAKKNIVKVKANTGVNLFTSTGAEYKPFLLKGEVQNANTYIKIEAWINATAKKPASAKKTLP
jgi:hypothetical protein